MGEHHGCYDLQRWDLHDQLAGNRKDGYVPVPQGNPQRRNAKEEVNKRNTDSVFLKRTKY